MGNGAKAASKRERNAKDNKKQGAQSQLKQNEAAKSVQCNICKQTWLTTVRQKALEEHLENKHAGKEFADCFIGYVPA
ncbi:hypothetical protein HK098_005504 [Nowakowskiella sp. JEL0407]|nr:hypothetical protein HK098_005504 [Nowakowskiella sp. JEL0407]